MKKILTFVLFSLSLANVAVGKESDVNNEFRNDKREFKNIEQQLANLEKLVKSITPDLENKLESYIDKKFDDTAKYVNEKVSEIQSKSLKKTVVSPLKSNSEVPMKLVEDVSTQRLYTTESINKNISDTNSSGKVKTTTTPPKEVPVVSHTMIHTTTEYNKQQSNNCVEKQKCCKPAVVNYGEYKVYTKMDNPKLLHTTSHVNKTNLEDFEMDFGIRGDWMYLLLSPAAPWQDMYYEIVFTGSKHKEYHGYLNLYEQLPSVTLKRVANNYKPGVISPHHFTYYYIKMSDDKLEVGKRGQTPMLSYTSSELRKLKFFSFRWWFDNKGYALYDCPAA